MKVFLVIEIYVESTIKDFSWLQFSSNYNAIKNVQFNCSIMQLTIVPKEMCIFTFGFKLHLLNIHMQHERYWILWSSFYCKYNIFAAICLLMFFGLLPLYCWICSQRPAKKVKIEIISLRRSGTQLALITPIL